MARFLSDHVGLKMNNAGPDDHYNKLLYRTARLQVEIDKTRRAQDGLMAHQDVLSRVMDSLDEEKEKNVPAINKEIGDSFLEGYPSQFSGYTQELQGAISALSKNYQVCDREARNIQARLRELNYQREQAMKELAPYKPKLAIDFGVNPALSESQYKSLYAKMNGAFYGYNPTVRDYKEYIEGMAFKHGLSGRGGIMHTDLLIPGQPSVRLLFNEEDLDKIEAMAKAINDKLSLEPAKGGGDRLSLLQVTGQHGNELFVTGFKAKNMVQMNFVLEGTSLDINQLQSRFYIDAWEVSADTFVNDYKDEYEDGFLSFMKHEGADLEQDEQELSM